MSDYCVAHDNHYDTEDDLNEELDAILCGHLQSYVGTCAYNDLSIEWRSNTLCRK